MGSFEFGPRTLSIYFIRVFELFSISYLFCVYFVFNCYLSLNVMLCHFASCLGILAFVYVKFFIPQGFVINCVFD